MSAAVETASPVGETLLTLLGYNHGIARSNLEGISHDESLVQPTREGNCINWVFGHMVASRMGALELFGQELDWSDEVRSVYARNSEPLTDPSCAQQLDGMLSLFDRANAALEPAFAGLSEERLAEKAPFSPTDNPDETIGSLLVGLMFHEAYHVGQLGVLRRMIGKPRAV